MSREATQVGDEGGLWQSLSNRPREAWAQQGPYEHPRDPFIVEPGVRKHSCRTISGLTPFLPSMLTEPCLSTCLPTSLASEKTCFSGPSG